MANRANLSNDGERQTNGRLHTHDCEKQAQFSRKGITYLFCRRQKGALLPEGLAFYAAFKTQIRMRDREIAMLRRVSREKARQRNEIRMQFNVLNN